MPLLLSKKVMKKAQAVLDFKNGSLLLFDKRHQLLFTNSGHYCIPLSKNELEIEKRDREHNISNQLVLICSSPLEKKKVTKLHCQFCYCGA